MTAPLGPDEVRQLLRECVTVVRPEEVLAVRIDPGDGFAPAQVSEIARELRYSADDAGIRAVLVLGHEMATATPVPAESDDEFARRVARSLNSEPVRAAIARQRRREPGTVTASRWAGR